MKVVIFYSGPTVVQRLLEGKVNESRLQQALSNTRIMGME